MIMKWWILVVLVALLLFSMMFRERFEPTQKIKAPPYDEDEEERIYWMAPPELRAQFFSSAKQITGGGGAPAVRVAYSMASVQVSSFYNDVYKTATSPITVAQIDAQVARATQTDEAFRQGVRGLLKAYFIDQASAQSSAASPTGPAPPPSTGPPGTNTTPPPGTGPAAPPAPPPAPSPPAEPSQKSKIYGPQFTGLGTPDPNSGAGNGNGGSGQYPEIWGGGGSKGGPGGTGAAGGQGGSSIVMPPLSSLGLDSNAMYFPYSRSPGDMDLVPDPYRVAQSWLPSRYSYNKTEPAPFLTDFSAFLR